MARPKKVVKEEVKEKPVKKLSGWVKVTPDELKKLQDDGKLAGYRPDTQEAFIMEEKGNV